MNNANACWQTDAGHKRRGDGGNDNITAVLKKYK